MRTSKTLLHPKYTVSSELARLCLNHILPGISHKCRWFEICTDLAHSGTYALSLKRCIPFLSLISILSICSQSQLCDYSVYCTHTHTYPAMCTCAHMNKFTHRNILAPTCTRSLHDNIPALLWHFHTHRCRRVWTAQVETR